MEEAPAKPKSKDKKKGLHDVLSDKVSALGLAKLVSKATGDLKRSKGKELVADDGSTAITGVVVAQSIAEAIVKTDRTTQAVDQALQASTVDVQKGSGFFALSDEEATKLSADKRAYVDGLTDLLHTAQGQRVLGNALQEAMSPLFSYDQVRLTTDLVKIGADLAALKVIHKDLTKHTEDFANFTSGLKAASDAVTVMELIEEAPKRFGVVADSVGHFNSAMSGIQDHIAKTMTDRAFYAIQVTGKATSFERVMKIADSLLDVGLDVGGEVPDVYAKTAITVVQAVKPWLTMIGQEIYRDIMVEQMKTKEGRAAAFSKLKPLAMAQMLIANQKRLIRAVLDTASPGLAYIPGWGTFIKPSIMVGVNSFLDARLAAAKATLEQPATQSMLEEAGDVLKEMADELLPISEVESLKKLITKSVVAKSADMGEYKGDFKSVSKKFIKGLDLSNEAREKLADLAETATDAITDSDFDPKDLFSLLAPAIQPAITKVMVKIMDKLPFNLAAQVYTGDQLAADVQSIFMAGRDITTGSRKTAGDQEAFERPTRTKEGHKVLVIHSSALEKGDDGKAFVWALIEVKQEMLQASNLGNEEVVAKLLHPDWESVLDAPAPAKIADRPNRTSKSQHVSMFRASMAKVGGKDVYEVIVHNVWGWLDPDTRVFTPVRPDDHDSDDNTAWETRTVDVTGYTEFTGPGDKTGTKVAGTWYWPFENKEVLLFCRDDMDRGTWVAATQRLRKSPMGGQGQFGLAEHLGSRVKKGSKPAYWARDYGM